MKQPTILPALIIVDEEIAGLGWLANMERNYAFGNYVFFKKWWGKRTLDMGKALIKYWFDFQKDGEPLIDVVIGQTPKNNQKACKFIQKIGLTVLGTIPFMDDGDDMLISYATRKGLNYG
jgi:RimJ/RimL family protein N-acetyltransferase